MSESANNSYRNQQRQLVTQLLADQNKTSVVPVQTDFRNSRELCLTIISFLNQEIAERIHQSLILPLQEIEPGFHYYHTDEMHLTIKGVRVIHDPPNFTEQDISQVERLLSQRIPRHYGINFDLAHMATLSTSLAVIGYCDENFQRLVFDLNDGLRMIGLEDDKTLLSNTVFFGNVTFCRYTHTPSDEFLNRAESLKGMQFGVFPMATISLLTCNAVCALHSRRLVDNYHLNLAEHTKSWHSDERLVQNMQGEP